MRVGWSDGMVGFLVCKKVMIRFCVWLRKFEC